MADLLLFSSDTCDENSRLKTTSGCCKSIWTQSHFPSLLQPSPPIIASAWFLVLYVVVFFGLFAHRFLCQRRRATAVSHRATYLVTVYLRFIIAACSWGILTLAWYLARVQLTNYHQNAWIISLAVLQMGTIFFPTFGFLYLSASRVGLAPMWRAAAISLVWGVGFGGSTLISSFGCQLYWEVWPYCRLASYLCHTILYSVLNYRSTKATCYTATPDLDRSPLLPGATISNTPATNSSVVIPNNDPVSGPNPNPPTLKPLVFNRNRFSIENVSTRDVRRHSHSPSDLKRSEVISRASAPTLARRDNHTILKLGFRHGDPSRYYSSNSIGLDNNTSFEKTRYFRPLQPFGLVALLHAFLGLVTSVLAIPPIRKYHSEYACALVAEVLVLYTLLPYALYRTFLDDSRFCQSIISREDGYNSLEQIDLREIKSAVKLAKQIGSGAAGTVVRANFRGREVCVKKYVCRYMNEENLQNFQMETSTLGQLNHTNVVQVIGICSNTPYLYLVMEMCIGGDLYKYIHNPDKVLSFEIALIFMKDLAAALDYIHNLGIIHRDLKSLNVLLDKDMRIKLADFELSHHTGTIRSAANATECLGTLGWLAPEVAKEWPQRKSGRKQTRSFSEPRLLAPDVYAYGVIMYELLTRHDPPFTKLELESIEAFAKADPDPERFRVRTASDGVSVPEPLQKLLLSCVDPNPNRRPDFTTILRKLEGLGSC